MGYRRPATGYRQREMHATALPGRSTLLIGDHDFVEPRSLVVLFWPVAGSR